MMISASTALVDLRQESMERGDGQTTGWINAMMRQGCKTVGDLRVWTQLLSGEEWSFAYGKPPFVKARTVRGIGVSAAQAILDVVEGCAS